MTVFPKKTVYLAGPITGLSYVDARKGWRADFAALMPEHVHCLSPMRAKEFLEGEENLDGSPSMYPDHLLASPSGIVTRDRNDVRTSDTVVFNFLGADKASVGSCIELGWGDAFRKPMVMIVENEGIVHPACDGFDSIINPHWHCMATEIAGYVTPSLKEAAHVVAHLLTPGV